MAIVAPVLGFTPKSHTHSLQAIVVKVCSVVSRGGCRIGDARPTTSNCGRRLPCFACLANRVILTWMTPSWINFTLFLKGDGECRCRYGICCCFVMTERRKSFLSHMVPSVTDDQKRNLLSNPLFHQKDLFAPTTIEATFQAAGNVVHLGDGPTIPLRVRLGILLARGGILLPAR